VAEAVADGLRSVAEAHFEVAVVPVRDAAVAVEHTDLVIVGAPTHVHGMSRPSTRAAAAEAAAKPGSTLHLEPQSDGVGVRDWLADLGPRRGPAAAFDTRVNAPVLVTGHAGKAIGARLRDAGLQLVTEPESFLVDRENDLLPGELHRARGWGERIGRDLCPGTSRP